MSTVGLALGMGVLLLVASLVNFIRWGSGFNRARIPD
jgi:hypothetical protein